MNKVLLGDVAEEVRENYKETDGNPAVVGLEHLVPGEIRLKEWSEDTNTTFTKAFHKGQVLFGRRRAYLRKAAVAPVDGICSGDITVISAQSDKILPELLPFVIQNDDFFDFAVGKSAGSLSPRVKWSRLKEYEFNLLSLPQQKKLAKLLWSFVDTKEAYEDLIRQTDELVKSQFIEMFGTYPDNEKNWPTGTIRDIAIDVRYGSSRKAADGNKGKYPYLRMNNITYSGELDLSDVKTIDIPDDELPKCSVRRGDLLFNRTNSKELVGKTCVYDKDDLMVLAGFVIRVRLNDRVLPEFVSAFLNTDFSKRMLLAKCKAAVGQANINAQEFQNIGIYIPPIEFQKEYLNLKNQSDKSKFELNEAIKDLDAMYKRIIKDNLG